ncbi:uncharacterized protein LOC133530909 [Cydia pomonella]|uniref:uncharacterized protein LOC133530909 n=1 Tax=Cydia pomonella TaxID=82600 RepID=UPI002ADD758E|nr:uncharacterized protein LOC133530909 [Cydia pomonella]
MKSVIILIFSHVLLIAALPFFKTGKYDWFWKKDFEDNTKHDNDPIKEFFRRSTTRRPHEAVTEQPDYDHTADSDYSTQDDLTAEPDYYTTEEYRTEPDYNPDETSYGPADYNTEEPDTEPDYYNTGEPVTEPEYYITEAPTEPEYYNTEGPTEPEYETTVEPSTEPEDTIENDKIRNNAYYEKRKKQALSCEGNEQVTFKLDEIGKPTCQLCTCNGEGILLCSRISCSDTGLDVGEHHEKLLHNSDSTVSLILREYATDCKPGTTVQASQCTCSCVLPSVMSCPKDCFSADTDDVTVPSDIIESYGITMIEEEEEVFDGVHGKH